MEEFRSMFEEGWDVKSTASQNETFWADKPTFKAVTLLKRIVSTECSVDFHMEVPGVVVCRVPDHNVVVNLLDPSGLSNRRGESYLMGDVLLALCIRRDEYTYSSVTKRGFKYINILERDRIKAILDDPEITTDLQEVNIRYMPIYTRDSDKPAGEDDIKANGLNHSNTSAKKIIANIKRRIEEAAEALKCNSNSEESREYKMARREHRRMCVLATALLERHMRTRNSVIMAHGEGFERILQKVEASHSSRNKEIRREDAKSVSSILGKHSKLRVLDEICCKYRKKPVIIVPSGVVSIVSRQNIKQLLEDNQFIDSQESLRNNGSMSTGLPMNAVEVVHSIAGRNIKFRVVECSYTSKFSTADWISVVCVVLNIKGGSWQFSGYPFESFVDMFMTMKGALFTYDTDNIPIEMNNWDIKVFRINRSHRHHDASIVKDFWQYMENFLLQPRNRKIHQTKRLT